MSICSRHVDVVQGCHMCESEPRDILPGFEVAIDEAEAAGLATCSKCHFSYYLSVNECPVCGSKYNGSKS